MTEQHRTIRWGRALAIAFGADVVLVAMAFAWVALWSHGIDPGHDAAYYEAHAAVASPWVCVTLGMPLFYAGARRLASATAPYGAANVAAVVAIYVTLEGAIILAFSDDLGYVGPMAILSFTTKALAAWAGTRVYATRAGVAVAA